MFAALFLEQSRRDKILVTPHKRRRSAVWGREEETSQSDKGAQCGDQRSETKNQ